MQHFLLSAASKTLSLKSIYKGGEDAAYAMFCKFRWPQTDGKAICPRCGSLDSYSIPTRRKFKCAGCYHQYSVTSGTIFASRKLAFMDMLAAICILANAAKGVSSLQLSRDMNVQYKTAFVFVHKLREAMASETHGHTLNGEVEIDGQYHGGHIRPANLVENRVDRRRAEYQTGTRRVVIVARQRKGRTLTAVVRSEADGVAFVQAVAARGAAIHADEASHWDVLHDMFPVSRINHSEAYCKDGACTNQAESYFSRLRRMVQGQHHFVSPRHLHQYAAHAAWLEDHRREDNGTITKRIVGLGLAHPVSRNWKGYWQGRT
jgi:transposase-like protein